MDTLLLSTDGWDLLLDAAGDIAVAATPYAVAQDAASAIKLFAGELYYDTSLGIPYFEQVLGLAPPLELVRAEFVAAALRVPEATAARCFLTGIQGRTLSGQVQVTTATGAVAVAGF